LPPDDDPFHNDLAQRLEIVNGIEQCIRILGAASLEDEETYAAPEAGEGGAMTEAPHGLLYRWYRIDRQGAVEEAGIVTPASHNFRVIERDLGEFVGQHRDLEPSRLRLLCEQSARTGGLFCAGLVTLHRVSASSVSDD
jgi:sulfhydrogenase subunit alpha